MNFIPKKRKREPLGLREPSQWRSARHLKFVRSLVCCVSDPNDWKFTCQAPTEAAHVRRGTDGGGSLKPSDFWTLPLCSAHHRQQHSIGEQSFEKTYRFAMKEAAEKCIKASPCRREIEEWRNEHSAPTRAHPLRTPT